MVLYVFFWWVWLGGGGGGGGQTTRNALKIEEYVSNATSAHTSAAMELGVEMAWK